MTHSLTYVIFGAPALGILAGIGMLFFLRKVGQRAREERQQAQRDAHALLNAQGGAEHSSGPGQPDDQDRLARR